MSFRPLGNKVLVKREEEVEISRGGIIIPGNAQEKPTTGEVIATGPGRVLENGKVVEPSVKKGDTVVFGKYGGQEITVGDDKLVLLSEDDIFGVQED